MQFANVLPIHILHLQKSLLWFDYGIGYCKHMHQFAPHARDDFQQTVVVDYITYEALFG